MSDFHALTPDELKDTLIAQLTPLIDQINQDIFTGMGFRGYRVFLVKTRWTGARVGDGQEKVIAEDELLPVPKVGPSKNLARALTKAGLTESGEMMISAISLTYTETELTGGDRAANEEFWYEICDMSESEPKRRRFALNSVPERVPGKFQWVVYVKRAARSRDTQGKLQS